MSGSDWRTIPLLLILLLSAAGSACSRAEGTDPDLLGKLIVGGGALLVVIVTLYYCVLLLTRPGEEDPQHVKRRILRDRW